MTGALHLYLFHHGNSLNVSLWRIMHLSDSRIAQVCWSILSWQVTSGVSHSEWQLEDAREFSQSGLAWCLIRPSWAQRKAACMAVTSTRPARCTSITLVLPLNSSGIQNSHLCSSTSTAQSVFEDHKCPGGVLLYCSAIVPGAGLATCA